MNTQTNKTAANSWADFLRPRLALLAETTRNAGSALIGGAGALATGVGDFASSVVGRTPDYVQREKAVTDATQAQMNKRLGQALLTVGLGSAGVGAVGTRLHQMLSNLNKPEDKHTKFIPGSHPIDDDEKIAQAPPANPNETFADRVGQFVLSGTTPTPINPDDPQAVLKLNNDQYSRVVPAALLTSVLGLYGGHKLMNSIYQKRRKEDLAAEVAAAKKDYERALIGKRAEVLDRAFEKSALTQEAAMALLKAPFSLVSAAGLGHIYNSAVLGTALAGGKMTYDWTRERGRDKALERARKSRARLAGSVPLYVDPDQLAAVKKLVG